MNKENILKNLESKSLNIEPIHILSAEDIKDKPENLSIEPIHILSAEDIKDKPENRGNKYNDLLKGLKAEMRVRGMSPNTVKMYLFYNGKFLEFIKKNPEDVTENDIKEFLSDKLSDDPETSISKGSVNLIKNALKFYYGEILGKNISKLKAPRSTRKLPIILNKTEIKDLLDKTENAKHRLMIELFYSTGLRLSELVNLKYTDLELSENKGWVRNGKGGKDRIFIISETFKEDLLKYMEEKEYYGKGYIFTVNGRKMSVRGIQHAIKISAKRANIEKNVHCHTLRHSFATHLLENGVDTIKIQHLLGHASLQTTQIYVQISNQEIKKVKSPLDNL